MNIYVPGGLYSFTTNSNAQSQEWLPCPTNQNRHGGKEMRERKIYAYNKRWPVNVEVESRIPVTWDTTLGRWATSLNTGINKWHKLEQFWTERCTITPNLNLPFKVSIIRTSLAETECCTLKLTQHVFIYSFICNYSAISLLRRLRRSRGSVLAISTQVCGLKPGRIRRIFRAKKSSARLPSEGK